MSGEINNNLDCCIDANKQRCTFTVGMIPSFIYDEEKRKKYIIESIKRDEYKYNTAKSNVELAKKQEVDMKKYVKQIIDKEGKIMKERKRFLKSHKTDLKKCDKEIALLKKQLKTLKKRLSVCNKKSRCPRGTRKNKKTGICEKK